MQRTNFRIFKDVVDLSDRPSTLYGLLIQLSARPRILASSPSTC